MKLVFRFDIDTHKCIRDGVPNLLKIATEYNIPFTFYLNTGRAISIKDSLNNIVNPRIVENAKLMSSLQKLGIVDYFITAIINPVISTYKGNIKKIIDSGCELGIHGGKNHSHWANHVLSWSEEKIVDEIQWSIKQLKSIIPSYTPCGFAPPEWVTNEIVLHALDKIGFKYVSDFVDETLDNVICKKGNLIDVGCNMYGNPGAVAYFENRRVRGLSSEEIVSEVTEHVKNHKTTVLFDHPFYAGMCELDVIKMIIEKVQSMKDVKIVTMKELAFE